MDEAERIQRLEMVVARLLAALERKGTERDGNWGWPGFKEEIADLRQGITPPHTGMTGE